MSDRRTELKNRHRELLAKSAAQRGLLATSTRDIERRLRGLDHVIDITRRFVAQPVLLASALATVMLIGPKRLLSWAGRALVLVSTGRQLLKRVR
jgi:hypothetical protein